MDEDLGAPASPSGSRATHEARSGLHPSGFDPSRIDRETIQQVYIRVCRDSGFQLGMDRACQLAARIVGKHPLDIWLAMPGLNVMFEIAAGTHPAAHRDSDRNPEGGDAVAVPSRSDESAVAAGQSPN